MSLLFRLAEWHALAKLRMHTESTLTQMEKVTTILGSQLRDFSNITCKSFKTTELPKEAEARARRETRQQSKQAPKVVAEATPNASSQTPVEATPEALSQATPETSSQTSAEATPETSSQAPAEESSQAPSPAVSAAKGKRPKTLNLFVYKLHALGDYAATIRLFGTSDSYSTQIVSIILRISTGCTYLHDSRENWNIVVSSASIVVRTKTNMSHK